MHTYTHPCPRRCTALTALSRMYFLNARFNHTDASVAHICATSGWRVGGRDEEGSQEGLSSCCGGCTSAAVWSRAHTARRAEWKAAVLGDRNNSGRPDQMAARGSRPSTSDVTPTQRNCCVTHYQTGEHWERWQGQCHRHGAAQAPPSALSVFNSGGLIVLGGGGLNYKDKALFFCLFGLSVFSFFSKKWIL